MLYPKSQVWDIEEKSNPKQYYNGDFGNFVDRVLGLGNKPLGVSSWEEREKAWQGKEGIPYAVITKEQYREQMNWRGKLLWGEREQNQPHDPFDNGKKGYQI